MVQYGPDTGAPSHTARQWCALIPAVMIEVCGTLLLRASVDAPWLVLVTLLCYGFAVMLLTVAMRAGMLVGVAYGFWAATGVIATALLANVFFEESLTVTKGIGFIVIAIGVVLVEMGTRQVRKDAAQERVH